MRRIAAITFVVLIACGLAVTPSVAAAEETRTGGTVVIEEGETVEDLTVAGGSVVIDGTVDGELIVVGGTVTIDGEVTDSVTVLGGDVRITGDAGDVEAVGGNVWLAETATVNGSVAVAAGAATVDGTVLGNVEVGAGTITFGPSATVNGDLTYAGELDVHPNADIVGETVRDPAAAIGPVEYPAELELAIAAYILVLNFLLGAILLALGPRFAVAVGDRFAGTSLASAGVGLLGLIGIPLILGALALSVVGLPLALVGVLLFAVFVWIATVYGRFAVGLWFLSLINVRNRWLGLVLGLVVVAVVGRAPYVGNLIVGVVTLMGVGAVLLALGDGRRTEILE